MNWKEKEVLREYTNDTDPDDLGNAYVNNLRNKVENPFPIDYKTIVIILLLSNYQGNQDYAEQLTNLNSILEDIIDNILPNKRRRLQSPEKDEAEAEDTSSIQPITELTIKEEIINNAVRLYTLFFTLPKIYAFSHQQSNEQDQSGELNLYSGIRSYKGIIADNLAKLTEKEEWYLPTFVSTSVFSNTALRFQDEKIQL